MCTPNGQLIWILSLFNCIRKTTSTKSALNMKNAKTDLLRSSIKSFATRACFLVTDACVICRANEVLSIRLMDDVTDDGIYVLVALRSFVFDFVFLCEWFVCARMRKRKKRCKLEYELRGRRTTIASCGNRQPNRRRPEKGYLLRGFIVSNICFDAEWPFNVYIILVQLQQKHNQHEEGVHHEERKHRWIP